MNELKNLVIDKIINILSPLRNNYPEEINEITNDLINYKYNSLINFIKNHYENLNYSEEMKDLVTTLIDKKLLDDNYKDLLVDKTNYQFISLKANNFIEYGNRPLNVKEDVLNIIKNNTPKPSINIIKTNNTTKELVEDDESDINYLRKKILDAQLNYINNANNFIKSLEDKDEHSIYQSLIDLNDIRFIQHSLSKLSINTLERLLVYVEKKTSNKSNSIDMFIIAVIKKFLRPHMP